MRGVVLADERSGPGGSEEWSWQIRGVVLVDQRSGPGRWEGVHIQARRGCGPSKEHESVWSWQERAWFDEEIEELEK